MNMNVKRRLGVLPLSLVLAMALPRLLRAHHPHDVVTAVAASPNFTQDRTVFVAAGGSINLFLVSRDGGYSWHEARSGIRGSTISAIRFASDWSTSGRAFVALADVGIQVTTDSGKTWSPPAIRRFIRHMDVSSVHDGSIAMFHATRDELFMSDDGGSSDRALQIEVDPGAEITSVTVSPTYWQDSTVVVTTSNGRVLMSQDRGATWTSTALPAAAKGATLSPGFAHDRTMCVATWGKGVFASLDGGTTFQPFGSIGDRHVNQVRLARHGGKLRVLAATKEHGVYTSDEGRDFTRTSLRVKLTNQTTNHHRFVTCAGDGTAAMTVFCGTFEGLHISDDGGATWRKSNINPTRSGRMISFSPTFAEDRTLFAAGYGMHALVSRDAGKSFGVEWDFPSWSTYGIGISPRFTEDSLVHFGMGGYLMRSVDGGKVWTWKKLPADPGVFYRNIWEIEYPQGFGTKHREVVVLTYGGAIYRSKDAGETWGTAQRIDASEGRIASTPDRNNFYTTALAVSPAFLSDGTMYACGSGLYRSTDRGVTFERLRDGKFGRRSITFAPDYATSGEVYCLEGKDGFVRLGKGADWTPSNDGLEGFMPSRVVASPSMREDATLFVTTHGGGVFRSQDRGLSWQRVSAFPSPVDNGLSLAISPNFAEDSMLFVGAFDGFYRSNDAGATWTLATDFEVYDDFREPWTFDSHWAEVRTPYAYNSNVRYATEVGARASLPITGRRVALRGPKGPDFGVFYVWIDGRHAATIDAFAEAITPSDTIFESDDLNDGYHLLEVTVSSRRNPQSTGNKVGIDAATVLLR